MFRHRTGSVTEELQLVPPSKLAIEDVSKTFQAATGKVLALDHVNLQVNEGEFVCLVGPSGCGKTTLLNIIAGLEKPDNGSVRADGKPVTSPGRDRLVMEAQLDEQRSPGRRQILPRTGWSDAFRARKYPRAFRRDETACGFSPCARAKSARSSHG